MPLPEGYTIVPEPRPTPSVAIDTTQVIASQPLRAADREKQQMERRAAREKQQMEREADRARNQAEREADRARKQAEKSGIRPVQQGESLEIVAQPFEEATPEIASQTTIQQQSPVASAGNPPPGFTIVDPESEEEQAYQQFQRSKNRATAWEKFKVAYDMSMSDVTSWSIWLNSKYPMMAGDITLDKKSLESGNVIPRYRKPEELYGSEFLAMNEQQRRERMLDLRAESIYQEHKELIDSGFLDQREEDPWYDVGVDTLGGFAGALTSPTTLIPVGKGYKALALIGGFLAGEHNIGGQLAETGEVDATEALLTTAVGAIATPALVKMARVTGGAIKRPIKARLDAKRTAAEVKTANETIDNINDVITEEVANGAKAADIPAIIARRTGLSRDDVLEATAKAERKIFIPPKKTAMAAVQMKKAADGTVPPKRRMAFVDDVFTILSTKIRSMSEPVLGRLRELDFRQRYDSRELLKSVAPFLETIDKLPKRVSRMLNQRLINGDFNDVEAILKQYTKNGVSQFSKVREVLADIESRLKEAGYKDLGSIENYFPRTVKDVDSLLSKLGATRKSFITKALERRAKALGLGLRSELPREEVVDVVNKVMRGYVPLESGAGFTKSRQIARVTDDILDEYANPSESLHTYIRRSINDIEKRKFFGRSAVDAGVRTIDTDKSIGNFVADELKAGNISEANADELARLLKVRFISGEKASSDFVSALRNIGYGTTLANPISAATQLGDLAIGAVINGVRPTLRALFSKSKVRLEDLGLDDVIAAEFANVGVLSKLLQKSLTLGGFRHIDRLGKTTFINAALIKAFKAVKTSAGEARLRKKWGRTFGDEMTSLVDDLKAGNITDNVKLFLWNELADVQPISLSEMPIKYLQSPDGRLFYSMKTFALKQIDILRREVFQQAKDGNYKDAAKFLTAYMTIVPMMGAGIDELKDMLLGRELDIDDFPDEYVENIFKVFMASEYMVDNYLGQGRIAGAVGETLLPPTDWLDAIGSDIMGIASGDKVLPEKTIRQLPVAGRLWYEWFGGGMERAAARKE